MNNLACLGYEEGERVLWGATERRGKVWQQRSGSIADWISWSSSTWGKVTSDNKTESNIVRDFLRPERLRAQYVSPPIAVQWGEQAQMRFNDRQFVLFGDIEIPVFTVDLEIGESTSDGGMAIRVVSDEMVSEYRLLIDDSLTGGYQQRQVSGPPVLFRKANDGAIAPEEYLQKDPFLIRYADGTYSYNCYHILTNLNAGFYDRSRLGAWDWQGIPLQKESMHKEGDQVTIQYRTDQHISDEYDLIFNDNGSGEAADLVCLKDPDETSIRLALVHGKGAHGGKVSQDICNFYTVCGQTQKCITAKHAGLPNLYHDLKRRQEQWAKQGCARFLKGDMKKLSYFKEKARKASLGFEVILVQPGASIASVTDDALRLLATTELYLLKTTQAKVSVVLSA